MTRSARPSRRRSVGLSLFDKKAGSFVSILLLHFVILEFLHFLRGLFLRKIYKYYAHLSNQSNHQKREMMLAILIQYEWQVYAFLISVYLSLSLSLSLSYSYSPYSCAYQSIRIFLSKKNISECCAYFLYRRRNTINELINMYL